MPGKVWTGGFELGYAKGKSAIPSLNVELTNFANKYQGQRDLADKRQKDFEDARKLFMQQQGKEYDPTVYEDQFDDTGITDFDVAGEKFRTQIKDLYELNQFAFNNGFIDETRLSKRNSAIKGQVQELSTVYDDINKFVEQKTSLEKEGKKNDLNDLKLEVLGKFNKNLAVNAGLDGIYMSTIKNGERLNASVSDFKKILNLEEGVDLDSVYDTLLQDQGFVESIVSGKKVTKYTEQEGGMDVIDAKISSMTDGQIIGALLQSGDISADDIGDENIINPKATDENKQALKESMLNQLKSRQQRKQKEEIYRDPYASRKTGSQRVREDAMRAAYEIAEKIGEGGEEANRLIDQVVANNDSIENILYNKEKDSWVVEKIDSKGKRSDAVIRVPRDEDGSVDSRNLGVSLMSAISPSYNVEQAELAARDFEKKNPNFNFSNNVDDLEREYLEFPSLDSIAFDKNQSIGGVIDSLDDDDVYKAIPQILSKMGIDKGYTIDEIDRTGFAGFFTTASDAVKITIPGYTSEDGTNSIIIEPSVTDSNELKEKIRLIANSIKKSGGLIQSPSSGSPSATGKKKLPTG